MSFGYDNGVIYDIGQAFVIFKKSEAAESVVRKLDEGWSRQFYGSTFLCNFL